MVNLGTETVTRRGLCRKRRMRQIWLGGPQKAREHECTHVGLLWLAAPSEVITLPVGRGDSSPVSEKAQCQELRGVGYSCWRTGPATHELCALGQVPQPLCAFISHGKIGNDRSTDVAGFL